MTNDEQCLTSLWQAGFRSEGIGPQHEWDPVPGDEFQERHNGFWKAVGSCIIPEQEDDEPFWMTTDASDKLRHN